ncbi:uncharacterized protein LOC126265407 [Aethina tumida]|uniref:uncharacterized protein LOC126265407 n=1 Tax=Aethina tumida TaxID=116153 RepID=UPI002148DE8C|nr:uncharacterized protein LOC126265407 [Aethina tumida]
MFVSYVLGATLPNDNITPKYFDGIIRNGIAEEIVDTGSTAFSGQQETGTATGVSTADGIPAQLHDVVDFGDSAPLTAVKEKRCPRVGAPILQLAKRDIDKSRLFDMRMTQVGTCMS